jgi:hypothetical protein
MIKHIQQCMIQLPIKWRQRSHYTNYRERVTHGCAMMSYTPIKVFQTPKWRCLIACPPEFLTTAFSNRCDTI